MHWGPVYTITHKNLLTKIIKFTGRTTSTNIGGGTFISVPPYIFAFTPPLHKQPPVLVEDQIFSVISTNWAWAVLTRHSPHFFTGQPVGPPRQAGPPGNCPACPMEKMALSSLTSYVLAACVSLFFSCSPFTEGVGEGEEAC